MLVIAFGWSLLQWCCSCCLMLCQWSYCICYSAVLCSDVCNTVCNEWKYDFSSLLAYVKRSEIGLYELPRLCCLVLKWVWCCFHMHCTINYNLWDKPSIWGVWWRFYEVLLNCWFSCVWWPLRLVMSCIGFASRFLMCLFTILFVICIYFLSRCSSCFVDEYYGVVLCFSGYVLPNSCMGFSSVN